MKRHKYKFKRQLINFIKDDINKQSLLYLKNNSRINYSTRQYITSILHFKYSCNNYNRLQIFCLITGKTKFVMRNFKISRMVLLENISRGFIIGFHKK